MAQKEIIWSDLAKSELQNILEFYLDKNKSPFYSLKLLKEKEDLGCSLKER